MAKSWMFLFSEKPDSQISSFSQDQIVDDDGKTVTIKLLDDCTVKRKIEILKLIQDHPKWSLSTIQRNGAKEFKYSRYKTRWEDHVKRGGTRFEQWKYVDEYAYKKFVEARQELKCVHESTIKLWALEAAQSFRDPSFNFKASSYWMAKFKENHGITSRKITKLVSRREATNADSILTSAGNFQTETKELAKLYPPERVINSDQAGFLIDLNSNRTLSHIGEKLTMASVISPTNASTHSYTCQYVISLAGTIVGNVFLCLQEKTGRMGDRVKKNLFPATNVTVTCSSSGKLTTSLYEYFLDNIIVKNMTEDFLYIIDSWGGQTNATTYSERFDKDDSPSCKLKIIPKKCTSLCQPLDTTFHRQLKYFARALHEEFKLKYSKEVSANDEITTRNNIIKMHSILHNQLSAPIFQPMIKYCWFSSGLSDDKPLFKSVREACFHFETSEGTVCGNDNCKNPRFVKCAHCRKIFCFPCFFIQYHFHS